MLPMQHASSSLFPFLNSQRFAGCFLENSPFLDNANAIGFGLGFIAFFSSYR